MENFIAHFQLKENELYPENLALPIYSMTVMNLSKEHVPFYKQLPNLYVSTVNVEGISKAYDLIQKI